MTRDGPGACRHRLTYLGNFSGYECWWHTKNQAWNTTTSSNFNALAQHFGLDPGTSRSHWCVPSTETPQPSVVGTHVFFDAANIGAWGWCGGASGESGGWVCMSK